jgi:uncharacterized OsmC-like protein
MSTANLREIQERAVKALSLRPAIGIGTATTTARIRDGLTCDVEDGHWRFVADEMPGDGGAGLGPDPGVYGRAALASCLAVGYVMWAARLQVPLDSVEVVVEADYDARGMYGVDDSITPGWQAVRYKVKIASSAPETRVRELVETADRYSSLLDAFKRPLEVTGDLEITSMKQA